ARAALADDDDDAAAGAGEAAGEAGGLGVDGAGDRGGGGGVRAEGGEERGGQVAVAGAGLAGLLAEVAAEEIGEQAAGQREVDEPALRPAIGAVREQEQAADGGGAEA